jgi:hypothetical protein
MHNQSEPNVIRVAALDENSLAWAGRVVWAMCVGVYLTVFIGGIQAGGAELISVGRAAAFTLGVAVLGKIVLSLLASASSPVEQGPMANQDGKLGSLVDLDLSANVPQHQDEALMAASGER